MADNRRAFVIMPFDPEFRPIYDDLIKPALEEAGYDVARADSFLDQQNILRDIVRGIAAAHLVVAEVTTLNPNVLYELGLCHGLGIPTIMLAQSMDDVPFDLRSYRIVNYSTRFDRVHELRNTLRDIGTKHKQEQITFGSPVTDFLASGPAEKRQAPVEAETPSGETEAPTEQTEEKGFLDFVVDAQQSAEDMARIMTTMAEDTGAIGDRFRQHTARIQALLEHPGPGTAAAGQRIASDTARDMITYSDKLQSLVPELENSVDLLIESYSGFLNWSQPSDADERAKITEFRQTIVTLLGAARESLKSTRGFRDSVTGLRGVSRDINRASRRTSHALSDVMNVLEKVEAFCSRSLPLIDEKLEGLQQQGGASNA